MDSVLPLCACGCGESVTKLGNRYIHNHHRQGFRGTPTYAGVHQRLMKYRGSAKDHPCAHCGARAQGWAFDNADPKIFDPKIGAYFADDLERYLPLCRPCHITLDQGYVRCAHGPDVPRYNDRDQTCSECARARKLRRSQESKDRANAKWRERYANDPEFREAQKKRQADLYANDPEFRESMKRRAKEWDARQREKRKQSNSPPESSEG